MKHPVAAGFTLVELLAAVAIFAIMALMAYGGLAAVLKAHTAVEGALNRTAEIQKAIYRLQSDLEQARPRPIRDAYGDQQPAFVSREEGREGLRVEFTRGGWRNPRLLRRSAFERVAYGLKDNQLVRYSWPNLDRAQEDEVIEVPLVTAVEAVEWHFLDAQGAWQDNWPPPNSTTSQPDQLPMAVGLVLVTRDWGEIHYLFRLINAPFAAQPTPPPPASGVLP